MTLRRKTLLIVATILFAFLVVAYTVSSAIIRRSALNSETREARRALDGAVSTFNQTVSQLDQRFADWSAWDDTYRFVKDRNQTFIDVNLNNETLANLQLNLLLIVDNSGRLVWGTGFDSRTKQKTTIPPTITQHLKVGDKLLEHPSLSSSVSGLFLLPNAPLLLAARPILTSKNSGPIRGTLIVGRSFGKSEIDLFSQVTRLPVAFARHDDPELPLDFQRADALPAESEIGDQLDATGAQSSVQALSDTSLAAYTIIPDIYRKPALYMRVALPRETYRQSQLNLQTLMISLVLAGLVFSGVSVFLLQNLVLSRWEHLSADLKKIGQSQDFSARVQVKGNDELSAVAFNTNQMLKALEKGQQELQLSEARFKAFINHNPVVAFMKDAEGRYVYVNQTFEERFNLTPAEWKDKTDFDLWPPEIAQPMNEVDRGVLALNQALSLSETTSGHGGDCNWLSYKFPLRDASGQMLLGGISIDITEQKKTEEALRSSQRFLQSTLDSLTAHIAILDETGTILAVNEAWRRFAQNNDYVGDDYGVGSNYLQVCAAARTEHEADLTAAAIRAMLSKRLDRFSLEYPCPSRNEGMWFHMGATRFSVDGTMRIVIAHENITERKKMEHSLRESEQRFRQVAENINEVFWLVDVENSQLLYVSPAYEAIWGRRVNDLYRNPGLWLQDIHPDDRARIEEAARTKQSKNEYDEEFRILRADGQTRVVHDRAFPIHDGSGKVYRVVGVAEDVTERTLARRELQTAHDEMEARVERRTAQLAAANTALQVAKEEAERAKEEAERANEAKSELLSRVSHELRTPMNAILGFGELLAGEELDESQQDSVNEILGAGNHLLELINHVLDLATLEQHGLEVETGPIEVVGLIQQCVVVAEKLAAEHSISIHFEAEAPDGMWGESSAKMLSQVVSILLDNAIKYNRKFGHVYIDVEKQDENVGHNGIDPNAEEGRPSLRIKIRDTGPGLEAENASRAFAPFDRLNAEELGVSGTGIGLTLAKSVSESMGAHVGVESIIGQGSTFWVQIPLWEGEPPNEEPVEIDVPTVLHIEDNPSNIRLVERILARRKEFALISASKGEEGIAVAINKHPKLILLDLHLPDAQGEDIFRRLKSEPETEDIPIVIVSADATAKQIERLRASGAVDYLTKPIDVQRLLYLLDEIMTPA